MSWWTACLSKPSIILYIFHTTRYHNAAGVNVLKFLDIWGLPELNIPYHSLQWRFIHILF